MKRVGIYNPYLATMGGGENVTCVMAAYLSSHYDVTIITANAISRRALEERFHVDLHAVRIHVQEDSLLMRFLGRSNGKFNRVRRVMYAYLTRRRFLREQFDIFICNYFWSATPNYGKKGIYICMFPQKLTDQTSPTPTSVIGKLNRWCYSVVSHAILGKGAFYTTYNAICANSSYTKTWIQNYWNHDSTVLYPPCEQIGSRTGQKRNIILHVGRFFVGTHSKKQRFLVSFFREHYERTFQGWELHLAGTVHDNPESREYLRKMQVLARGYPIYFHLNIPSSKLHELYQQSTIYWHATGYHTNEREYPESQEHFGITTVEAMSAGAVPIVINRGGQPEIVRHGEDGFLWRSRAELLYYTRLVMKDESLRRRLHEHAVRKSMMFNRESFTKNLQTIIDTHT